MMYNNTYSQHSVSMDFQLVSKILFSACSWLNSQLGMQRIDCIGKNPHVSGPVQPKPMFKGQMYYYYFIE